MKKVFLLLTIAASVGLFACGGKKDDDSSTNDNASAEGVVLKSWEDRTSVDGEAGKFIELIDKEITLTEREEPMSKEKEGNWGTSIKFKVIAKSDNWLDDMEITFLDEKGEQLYDFESTMTHDAMTRNGLLEKINEGSGFYEVDFHNFLNSTIGSSEEQAAEKVKEFKENISKAKYFKVMAKMKPNPNQHLMNN